MNGGKVTRDSLPKPVRKNYKATWSKRSFIVACFWAISISISSIQRHFWFFHDAHLQNEIKLTKDQKSWSNRLNKVQTTKGERGLQRKKERTGLFFLKIGFLRWIETFKLRKTLGLDGWTIISDPFSLKLSLVQSKILVFAESDKKKQLGGVFWTLWPSKSKSWPPRANLLDEAINRTEDGSRVRVITWGSKSVFGVSVSFWCSLRIAMTPLKSNQMHFGEDEERKRKMKREKRL